MSWFTECHSFLYVQESLVEMSANILAILSVQLHICPDKSQNCRTQSDIMTLLSRSHIQVMTIGCFKFVIGRILSQRFALVRCVLVLSVSELNILRSLLCFNFNFRCSFLFSLLLHCGISSSFFFQA